MAPCQWAVGCEEEKEMKGGGKKKMNVSELFKV